MNRELPVTIRKTLQAALDGSLVAIEEKLQNQLENIVRDVHETLTRNYLNSVQPSESFSEATAGPSNEAGPVGNCSTTELTAYPVMQPAQSHKDALASFLIPPDASSPYPLQLPLPHDSTNTVELFSDSAYHSNPRDAEQPCFDNTWLDPDCRGRSAYEGFFGVNLLGDITFETIMPSTPLNDQPVEQYTGKGKGRADPNSSLETTYPDFGPWVPDRSV
jgi:hypothetical protein